MTIKQILDENIRAAAGALAKLSHPEKELAVSAFASAPQADHGTADIYFPGIMRSVEMLDSTEPRGFSGQAQKPRIREQLRTAPNVSEGVRFSFSTDLAFLRERENTPEKEKVVDIHRISDLVEKDTLRYVQRFT